VNRRLQYAPLGREDLPRLLQSLKDIPTEDWPKYLKRASDVIANECGKPDAARAMVLDALAIAHNCAQAINSKAMTDRRDQARIELGKAAKLIRNCLKRIKAPIRRAFDQAAKDHFGGGGVDSEKVEAFLHECAAIAEELEANADRILSVLGRLKVPEQSFVSPASKLINDYESLHPEDRLSLENSLNNLTTALSVFGRMAACAKNGPVAKSKGADVVVAYLKEVIASWRAHGLQPAREQQTDGDPKYNQKYKGRFHRFAELILISRLDPVSRRFEPTEHDIVRTNENEQELEQKLREKAIPLRHKDLISDYRIRQALATDSKNDA
jgi:hypothetical protein